MRSLQDGTRDPGDLVPLVMAHLFDLCPTCATEFRAFQAGLAASGEGIDTPSRDRARARRAEAAAGTGIGEEEIRRVLDRLLSLPPRDRPRAICEKGSAYRSSALAALLLDRARRRHPDRPVEAHALARLCQTVLQCLELTNETTELYALAAGQVAHARRASGDLLEASEIFLNARFLLRQLGGGSRRTAAELDRLEGTLRGDLRELKDAEHLLRRSAMGFTLEDLPLQAAQSLRILGLLLGDHGRTTDAIQALEEALGLADGRGSDLEIRCRLDLACILCAAGRLGEAQELADALRPPVEAGSDASSYLRWIWLGGKIAWAKGEAQEAEDAFQTARAGFRQGGRPFDAALASLELAALYLEQNRSEDLGRLVEEVTEMFEGQHPHREVLAALMLFRDAPKLGRVSKPLLDELSEYLPRAQRDPNLPFQPPS